MTFPREFHEHPIVGSNASKQLHTHEWEPGHTHEGGPNPKGGWFPELGPGREYQPPTVEQRRWIDEIDVEMSGIGALLDGPGDDPRDAAEGSPYGDQ